MGDGTVKTCGFRGRKSPLRIRNHRRRKKAEKDARIAARAAHFAELKRKREEMTAEDYGYDPSEWE